MAFDPQVALNAAGFVISVLGGWWLNNLDRRFRDSEISIAKQEEKLQAVALLVAGNYVTKSEHEKLISAILKKLDAISNEVTAVRQSIVQELSEIKIDCAVRHGKE